MQEPLERARAYLDSLEADRQAALALSEQKAEEAKLIKARQEGFQAAMQMLGGQLFKAKDASSNEPKHPGRRRTRRRIPEMIVRELSFSGQAMTARQIAEAVDYTLERTETALERLEKVGQVIQSESGRWTIGLTQRNAHAPKAGNGKIPVPPEV
jgi:hypothetical protein